MDLRRLPWHLRHRTGARLASEARRLAVLATHRHCRVEFRGPVRLGPGFSLEIPGSGAFVVGPGVDFRRGFVCEISGEGRVTIGAGCVFTRDCLVQCSTSIDILDGSVIGASAVIVDGSHRFRDPDRPVTEQGYDFRPLVIGPEAWIMSHVTVAASVGRRAFVGAHAVVLDDIPPFTLAVGAPARAVEHFGPVAGG